MAEPDLTANQPRTDSQLTVRQGRYIESADPPSSQVQASAAEIRYRICKPEDAVELARLHVGNLSDRLPANLQTAYYRAVLACQTNFCICATDGAKMVGCVGVLSNRRQIIANLLKKELPSIVWIGLRSPRALWKGLGGFAAWLWNMRTQRQGIPSSEYRPVVVADTHRALGIARKLLGTADKALVERGIDSVFVRVASNNRRAAKLYENHGFRTVRWLGAETLMTRRLIACSSSDDRTDDNSGRDATRARGICPLCGADHVAAIAGSGTKTFLTCQQCTVRYFEPLRSREEVRTYFADAFITSERDLHEGYETTRDAVFTKLATLVMQKKPTPGRILDIGCAGGYFLDRYFAPAGWEPWAVELSKYAAGIASQKGIRVNNGELSSAPFPPAFFDVVTVLDTFYYFPEPSGNLRDIRKHIKADGLLFIELPHASPRVWRLTSRLAQTLSRTSDSLFKSDHIFFYTPKAVSMLLEKCGFRVEGIVVLPANARQSPYQGLLYHLYYASSRVAYLLSRSKRIWGPRFVVVASPGEAARQPGPSS